jgi:hypothetical protein
MSPIGYYSTANPHGQNTEAKPRYFTCILAFNRVKTLYAQEDCD